jgi:DNA repair exonuclease SbcCD nuclease subunit
MSRVVLLHAADLHLDAPFEGIGRTPPRVAEALRDASVEAWDALVDLALARNVAAVLLAGGLCAGLERGVRAQARLRDGIARLSAAGVPVFMALGDGDPPDGFGAVASWPSSVTVFPAGRPTAVPLLHDGRRIATIHSMSIAHQAGADDAHPRIARDHAPGPHLAVVHAAIAGHASDDGGCRVRYRREDLRTAAIDYWAMGHAVSADQLSVDPPWIVYPGTPQGRSLNPAHCGPKGAALIAIEQDTIAGVEFAAVDRVRCLRTTVEGVDDPAALLPLLRARAAELRESNPGRGLLLDARISGTPAVHRMLRQPERRAELLDALRAAAENAEPFLWWVAARAAQVPYADGDRPHDELAAEIHCQRAALAADAARCAGFVERHFEPLHALWTAEADARETAELLDAAAVLAIDALDEGAE